MEFKSFPEIFSTPGITFLQAIITLVTKVSNINSLKNELISKPVSFSHHKSQDYFHYRKLENHLEFENSEVHFKFWDYWNLSFRETAMFKSQIAE